MGPGFESLRAYTLGEVAEWSIAPVLKTDVLKGTGGSNPSLSARNWETMKVVSQFSFYSCGKLAYQQIGNENQMQTPIGGC